MRIRYFFTFMLTVMPFISCKSVQKSEEMPLSDEESVSLRLKIKEQDTYLKKSTSAAESLDTGSEKCKLFANANYKLANQPKPAENHYFITLATTIEGCQLKSGYVFADHVRVPAESSGEYCQYSWEQKPGTTDYTTRDEYSNTVYQGADRSQSATLVGSSTHRSRSLCQKAKVLKICFQKAIMDSTQSSAVKFREWARAHNINPILALMAKAEQETKMGIMGDNCYRGTCNGIGIGQIITAIDETGRAIANSDPRWKGITHNILTNLIFSVRVVAAKTARAKSLWDLAYYYNGSPAHQNQYADNVTRYYSALQQCSL